MDFAIQNKIKRRVSQLKKDGIRYVSGTVSPAESDIETMDIESLEKALRYYAEKGVNRLHIQPKWMGSRCQLYLFKNNLEKCFAVSRNGYKIRLDLTEVFVEAMKVLSVLDYEEAVESVILDGELLPWTAIGGSLIDREFHGLTTCVETEVNFLRDYGMPSARAAVMDEGDYLNYLTDVGNNVGRKEIAKHYGRFETYENVATIVDYSIEQEEADLELYQNQLNLYTISTPVQFKPFDILRIDYEDGTFNVDSGFMKNNYAKYSILHEDNPNKLEMGISIDPLEFGAAADYMAELVGKGYEGIMIKPERPDLTDAVYCMKVRNPEYLRIIYGYDYRRPENLLHLCQKKRVGKKRKVSHHEYRLGQEMLKLDPKDENYHTEYERIALAILFEIEEEGTLDARL